MSLANQIRILKANIQEITTQIGVGFAAAIRHVVILLNKLLEKVLVVAKAFSTFMQTLFGKYEGGAGGFTFEDYGMDEADNDLSNMSDSASDVADGITDADEATKKLAKDLSVLPFDELNQLSKDIQNATDTKKKDDPSSGTYTPNLQSFDDMMADAFDLDFGNLESPLAKLEDYISEWAKRIKEQFDKRNWDGLGREVARGINDFVDYLLKIFDPVEAKDKIGTWIDAFAEAFNGLIDELDFEDIGTLIGRGIDVVISSVNRLIEDIDWNRLGQQLANGANGLVEAIPFDEIGEFFANKLNMIWQTAEGFATTFDWANLGEKLAQGANAFIDKIDLKALANTLSSGLNGIAEAVNKFAQNFEWAKAGRKLAENANLLISQIDIESIGTALGNILNGLFTTAYTFVSNFNWEELGSMFARGINSLVDTVDFDLIASTVYTELNGIIDSVTSFLNDLDVVTAGNKLGAAFSKMINGVHWKDLGTALAEIWNKAWSFLSEFVSNLGRNDTRVEGLYSFNNISQSDVDKALKKGTGIGQALYDALKGAIDSVKIEDMKDSITTLVSKISQDIVIAFGDASLWYKIGKTIGDAIGGIFDNKDAFEDAADAVNALVDGITNFFKGAIDGLGAHKLEIGSRIAEFFKNLEWGDIVNIVGVAAVWKLVKNLPTILAGSALKSTLITELGSIFTAVGTSEEIVASGGTIFSSLKTALGGEGGVISLIVAATAEFQKFQELLRGGNGILTETGGAFDSFVEKLRELKIITKETDDKLFALKESLEFGDIDNATFISEFSKTLEEAGVNGEQAKNVVDNLTGSMSLTEEQVNALNEAIEGIGESTSNSTDILTQFGTNTKDAAEQVRLAINDAWWKVEEYAQDTGDTITEYSVNIQDQFMKMIASGGDFGQSLLNILPYFSDVEGGADALREAIDSRLGQEGIFDSLISGVNNSGEAFDATSTKAESYGNTVKTAGEIAEEATRHSREYNETTEKSPGILESLKPLLSAFGTSLLNSLGKASQYYDAMSENVEEGGKGVEDSSEKLVSPMETLVGDALTPFEEAGSKMKEYGKSTVEGFGDGVTNNSDKATDPVKTFLEKAISITQDLLDSHSPSKVYEGFGESVPEGFANGITNKESLVTGSISSLMDKASSKFTELLNTLKTTLEQEGSAILEKLVSGMQSKEDVLTQEIDKVKSTLNTFATSVSEIASSVYEQGASITGKLAEGMASRKDELDRVIGDISALLNEFATFISEFREQIEEDSRGITNGIVSGLSDGQGEISGILESINDDFNGFLNELSSLSYEFEQAGRNIIGALQDGLNSVNLMIPTISVDWDTQYYNNGQNWVDIPRFSVNYWAAKGGLFTDPSIIGVGEAGNEAVLPLTNRKTMSMIADAIVSNSSGIGLDEQSLVDAIAQGYVRAMMSNQDNQRQPIINVVCKTENDEVLFRAVERGRESVQYRNNPTAQFGY